MRIVRLSIILLGVGLGVVGCAGGPQLIPVTDPTQRLEFEGFSILPPKGENWFMAPPALRQQQGPDVIVSFLKLATPPSKTHTVAATVRGGRVPFSAGSRAELLQKFAQASFEQTKRNRPVSVNISPDRILSPDCVRYDATVEDRGVPGYPGSIYILDQHGFICLHPGLPDAAINIQYSQRRLQEEPPLALKTEGEPFVKSFLFKRLPGRSSPSKDFDLIDAAEYGDLNGVQSMLAKGANINTQNKYGATALMMASWNGHTEVVKALLAKGADVNVQRKDGLTALFMASQRGHKEIVSLLKSAGAK